MNNKIIPNFQENKEKNEEKWGAWRYNVVDKFKPLSVDQIKAELDKDKLPCAILMQHIEGDFNFCNIVRTSNNFNVSEIFYLGKRKWDKRSSCGTYNYSPVTYLSSIEEVIELKSKYTLVGLENNIGKSIPLESFTYPERPLFILGEEGMGIVEDLLQITDYLVEIPSRGSVRSLNVASAAAIVLYDYWLAVGWK